MMSECEIPPNADAQAEEDDNNNMDSNEPDEHVNRVDHQDAAEPEELEYADPPEQDAPGLEGLGRHRIPLISDQRLTFEYKTLRLTTTTTRTGKGLRLSTQARHP